MNNSRRRAIIKSVVIILAAILLEVFYFNMSYFVRLSFEKIPHNVMFSLEDFEYTNWTSTDEGLISQFDPILVVRNLNIEVKSIEIETKTEGEIPYVYFFYTNDMNPEFSEHTMVLGEHHHDGYFTVNIGTQVKDLRIDLGDDADLELKRLDVVINPLKMRFSVERFTTMIIICFGFWGLMRLQKSPDYGLNNITVRPKSGGKKDD